MATTSKQRKIDLNVGGIRYTTTLSTLTREPDSMLGRMFSELWSVYEARDQSTVPTALDDQQRIDGSLTPPSNAQSSGVMATIGTTTPTSPTRNFSASSFASASSDKDKEGLSGLSPGGTVASSTSRGEVFLDADGTHFRYVLNYLRRGESLFLPSNPDTLEELLVEAQYFALSGLINLIETKLEMQRAGMGHRGPLAGALVGNGAGASAWTPVTGDLVKWCPEAVDGYWRSVAVAIASFHYQASQVEAVCGFMHKTKFLPDDMEIFFLRCVSCRASTRVGEVWRYDVECLLPIKSVMSTMTMQVSSAPAQMNGRISGDCVTVLWSTSMALHVSKSALMPA